MVRARNFISLPGVGSGSSAPPPNPPRQLGGPTVPGNTSAQGRRQTRGQTLRGQTRQETLGEGARTEGPPRQVGQPGFSAFATRERTIVAGLGASAMAPEDIPTRDMALRRIARLTGISDDIREGKRPRTEDASSSAGPAPPPGPMDWAPVMELGNRRVQATDSLRESPAVAVALAEALMLPADLQGRTSMEETIVRGLHAAAVSVMELGRAWGSVQELGDMHDNLRNEVKQLRIERSAAEAKAKKSAEEAARANESLTKAIEELSAEQEKTKKLAEEIENQSQLLRNMERREADEADKNWQIGWNEAINDNYNNVVTALDFTYAEGWRAALKEAAVPPESTLWLNIPACPNKPPPPDGPPESLTTNADNQTVPTAAEEPSIRVEDYIADGAVNVEPVGDGEGVGGEQASSADLVNLEDSPS